MPKTKAEVAKMVRAQKIKQFSKLTLEQRKIKNGEIMRSARRNTAVGKIELSVLRKLILPEQKANKARTELKKTVPTTKKKVSRAELDKARVALQKKPVPKGSHRMPDGSIMKDSAMKKKPAPKPAPKKSAPKKTPAPTLDSLQAVMAVMTEVAKDKGKSTKGEIDSKVALDKKLQKGKLSNKEFKEFMFDDEDTMETLRDFEEQMGDGQSYNMDYWISRVSKRADVWDDLTDNQQERLTDIMYKDITTQTRKKMKAFYDKFIKGKKFNNIKEVEKLFVKEYDEVEFDH
jgi:hypothetical protein